MLHWISANLGTIVIAGVLLAVIVLISIQLIRDKKKGKSSCGCNCAHCAMPDSATAAQSSIPEQNEPGAGGAEPLRAPAFRKLTDL